MSPVSGAGTVAWNCAGTLADHPIYSGAICGSTAVQNLRAAARPADRLAGAVLLERRNCRGRRDCGLIPLRCPAHRPSGSGKAAGEHTSFATAS